MFWNFDKADWPAFAELTERLYVTPTFSSTQRKLAQFQSSCYSKIDARTNNSNLWSIAKSLSRDRPQVEQGWQNTERQAKSAVHKCRNSDLGDPVFLADFSMHELLLALNALDPKKSPGPDNIHRVKITHLGPSSTQHLLDIFNQSWKSGRLPHEWKRVTIIPIRRPGKTAIICFHGNNMDLGEDIVQKIRFCTFVNVSEMPKIEKKPTNHKAAEAFLDLSKAFDTVWRNKLILKMLDVFGIKGKALPWISDFFKSRVIRVTYTAENN
ncbi:putative RNA-directed DNA polymerase from transposon BS [Trichonephila clavipes]|nr:putative RNA-directed DNA polymerase from transposon BS [Trichonephila clavipes]